MATYYNKAGDLIVLASTCMSKGKTKKALECMELALHMDDMDDIVAGLKQLNTVEANEVEDENEEVEIDESCDDKNMDDEGIEESDEDEVEDEVDIDVDTEDDEDPEEETASADEDADEDADDEDDEVDVDEEEEEDIDEARVDEVLCALRKQYNITSSIKSTKSLGSRLAALASKAGK